MVGLLNHLPGEGRISAIRSRGQSGTEAGIEVEVDDVIVLATKATYAGDIGSVRRGSDDESGIHTQRSWRTAGRGKGVTGFCAASQDRVYQARRSRARRAGRRSRQIRQGWSKPNIGVSSSVSRLCRHDGADRGDSRRLIGGDSSAYQVGNGDGGDNENDRHDNQKLNQRKSLISLHSGSAIPSCDSA